MKPDFFIEIEKITFETPTFMESQIYQNLFRKPQMDRIIVFCEKF